MSNSKKDDQDYWKTRSFEERAIAQTWLDHLRETVDALGVKSVALADLKLKLMAAEYEIAQRKAMLAEVEGELAKSAALFDERLSGKALLGAFVKAKTLTVDIASKVWQHNMRSFDREENLIAPG